ncbi:MAG: hypothetical protein ACRCUY_06810 [Thermoguttaceae bacterium]
MSCRGIGAPTFSDGNKPSLELAEPRRDTIGLEVFTIRIVPQQHDLVADLWLNVDEQLINSQHRWELRSQGIRVGVMGAFLPPSLASLLNISSEGEIQTNNFGQFQEIAVADIPKIPAVSRQKIAIIPKMNNAILKPFDAPVAELPLFWTENGRYCGQTYRNALGIVTLDVVPQTDGTVLISLTPELEYGFPETKLRINAGIAFYESGRPTKRFDALSTSMKLYPGQWIILGAAAATPTGLGHALFVRGAGESEQKLLAIRLLHTQTPKANVGSRNPPPMQAELFNERE